MNMEPNQYETPKAKSEVDSTGTSVPRGCGFGCLYMIVAFIGFCLLLGLIAPLIFRQNLGVIGQVGSVIGMVVVAPIAGLIGFLQHRRHKRS